MKKQILSLAVIALLAFGVQSCGDKKETKPEEELTLGNKVDSLTTDIEEVKDSAVSKTENAAEDVKEATKKAAEDVKDATKKGAEKVEAAAKAAKDGTVQTAKNVNEALKK
ncbi:hypothetical protein [Flavobacterium ajazii]|uniref:hypothetical protein n=1 Tax=Flavobacterium ajazii TaxID=2692318 RepID=UPI0013D6F4EE|nr:hypothetical protein [Flavobacterium ajazii]